MNLESKLKNSFRKITLTAAMLAALAGNAFASTAIIKTYDANGNILPNVEVVATDGSGSTKLNTDGTGTAVFNKTGNTEFRIAKDNYLGAKQLFNVASDTTFHFPLICKEYIRNGTDTTGIDTVETRADELQSVHHIDNIQLNPILMNVEANWPNFNIPVMISSNFSDADSIKIRDWLTWRNNYSGKTLFNFAAFDTTASSTEQGIYMYPGTSNSTGIRLTGDSKYILQAGCKLIAPNPGSTSILKEASFRALTYPSGNAIIYTPTNYGAGISITTPKDEAYMMLAYMLQHLKEINKNNLDMCSFADSLPPMGVAGNPPEMTRFPFKAMNLTNYPNPTSESVTFSYHLPVERYNKEVFRIYNITGQVVRETFISTHANANAVTIDVKRFTPGVYFATVSCGNLMGTSRFLVVKQTRRFQPPRARGAVFC